MIIEPLPLPPLPIRLANTGAAMTNLPHLPTLPATMALAPRTGTMVATTAVYNVSFLLYPLRPG